MDLLLYSQKGIPEFLDSRRKCWTWTRNAGLWTLDLGRWTLDTRFWTPDTGCWTLDAGQFKFVKVLETMEILNLHSWILHWWKCWLLQTWKLISDLLISDQCFFYVNLSANQKISEVFKRYKETASTWNNSV